MSKRSVNWGNTMVAAAALAAVSSVSGLGYYLFKDSPDTTATAPDLREWVKKKDEIGEYRVTGPGQVVSEQGTLTYTFNFDSGHVFVTSTDINQSFSFRSFDNDAMIQQVKGTGCQIANDLQKNIETYKSSGSASEEYSAHINEYAAIGGTFKKNHCTP